MRIDLQAYHCVKLNWWNIRSVWGVKGGGRYLYVQNESIQG